MWSRTKNSIKVEREELYELVWSEPKSRLAKRYGISDVALAKISRKLEVPVPPRGYWAKKSAGKPTTRPPLPSPSSSEAAGPHLIRPGNSKGVNQTLTVRAAREAGTPSLTVVEVLPALQDPHTLVKRSKAIHSRRISKDGKIGAPGDTECLAIEVSRDQLDRALRVMDALIKTLETNGYTVRLSTDAPRKTIVTVEQEELSIAVRETQVRVPHLLTKEERRRRYYGLIPKYDYVGGGELALEIRDLEDYKGLRVRKRWADGKKQQVEACIGQFVEGLVVAAKAIKVWRHDKEQQARRLEEEARRRAEEQRRCEEEETRRREEEERVQKLIKQAEEWSTSENIRRFLRAAEQEEIARIGAIDPKSEFGQWLKWAYEVADRFDPLKEQ